MTGPVSNSNSVGAIMGSIDLGPSNSIQFMFAKLQLAQAQICKDQAQEYIDKVTNTQEEQKKCADMIALAREMQNKGEAGDGVGEKSISGTTVTGEDCAAMPKELVEFMDKNNLLYTNKDGDYILGKDEWEQCIKSLTNYQDTLGTTTQTDMVYLQDFMSQYNGFLQGANSAVKESNQTLTTILRG